MLKCKQTFCNAWENKLRSCFDIGPEHQFADHRAVHVQLDIPTRTTQSFSWFVPKSWTIFQVDSKILDTQYRQARSDQSLIHPQSVVSTPADVHACFCRWSSQVEKAVDRTLQIQHAGNPVVHSQRFLPRNYRGRCSTPRLIRNTCPRSPKRDTTGQYEPPAETTSLKSRHKTRQVRRLRCLERLYHKHHLDQCSTTDPWPDPTLVDLNQLWNAIRRAQGYGNSWMHWILQFESISAVPYTLPSFDLLYSLRQITQYDADAFCCYEAKLRRLSRKHEMELDTKFKSGAHLYKRLKAQEDKILPGFPTKISAQASLHFMEQKLRWWAINISAHCVERQLPRWLDLKTIFPAG